MKNKIEFKKAILVSCAMIVMLAVIFQICLFYQYQKYTQNFNEKIAMFVTNIEKKYPDVKKSEIAEILNSKTKIEKDIFEQYGIDLKRDAVILENDRFFKIFSAINVEFVVMMGIIVLGVFARYNQEKDKKIEEITRYIEEINNKNYKLDIEDNTEDELSILKNEIYKTTVMLKETAENSQKDKISLKDSLSDISHQLKTPLTSITIMIDNIIDNPEMNAKTREEFMKDIKREIININFLVNSLLKLSKLDANSIHFIRKKIMAREIVQEAIKNVSVLCDLKNIPILVNEKNETQINCDAKWQTEAITNILKNCVEHSKNNSKIEICLEANSIYAKIEIRDYGIGIEEQDLPHVFERFYKGKNSANESVGIGLALAKSIIESDGGYIEVESEAGKGSVFRIKYIN